MCGGRQGVKEGHPHGCGGEGVGTARRVWGHLRAWGFSNPMPNTLHPTTCSCGFPPALVWPSTPSPPSCAPPCTQPQALDTAGLLRQLAEALAAAVPNVDIIAAVVGLASAVVDNVPLVAATMGMYDTASVPPDSQLWQLIALCAGGCGAVPAGIAGRRQGRLLRWPAARPALLSMQLKHETGAQPSCSWCSCKPAPSSVAC